MMITMVGDGALTTALTALAARATDTVMHIDRQFTNVGSCSAPEMMIVAGDRLAVTDLMKRVASLASEDTIIVDATLTALSDDADTREDVAESDWLSLLPGTRVVRAFASVPVEAFTSILSGGAASDNELAVPMAGDDDAAKQVVADFMRRAGLEPFDLGPLTVSYVLEPGGALWGKAVDALDMRECIGWLSGDG